MPSASKTAPPAGIEREIKLRGLDLDAAERTLRGFGAERCAEPHWERNWVLDRGGVLRLQGRLLRVREQCAADATVLRATVTVKRAVEGGAAGVKERHEREVDVDSAADALEAFALLGYEVARRYEKVRTAYRLTLAPLAPHEIVLDDTPMGSFVEIEGETPRAVAEALSWPLESVDLRNYLAIWDEDRGAGIRAAGESSDERDMLFGSPPTGFQEPGTDDSCPATPATDGGD